MPILFNFGCISDNIYVHFNKIIFILADNIIGRLEEKKILLARLETPESELIAVYGRRRVGKIHTASSIHAWRNGTVLAKPQYNIRQI